MEDSTHCTLTLNAGLLGAVKCKTTKYRTEKLFIYLFIITPDGSQHTVIQTVTYTGTEIQQWKIRARTMQNPAEG